MTGQIDVSRLAAYLRQHLHECGVAPPGVDSALSAERFPGGHSNLTYLIRFGALELVLRRPPPGPLPARAHDIEREFRWLRALHQTSPLVPRPYLYCADDAVVG